MADLFERLFPGGEIEPNIPVHAFTAAITDYVAGHTTRNQIIGVWSLDAEAQADMNKFCDAIDLLGTKINKIAFALELDAVMLLAEAGMKYTTKADFKTRLNL
ncbi:MAG: hypothetical protein KJ930_15800 [Gammaproteobacteria bacterium]|nr:hypothetical protein [Gammaproteobacteria bacterium]MBU2277814.1 hypothetical protein [Gammaproteobacteria bacterium]